MTNAACQGCHSLIDPLGFGFEHYDEIGAYRTVDNGLPVDAHGQFVSISDLQGPFDGAIELASKLSGSRAVLDCLARQWITALNQRAFDEQLDSCLLSGALDALASSGGDIEQMLIAIASNPSFQKAARGAEGESGRFAARDRQRRDPSRTSQDAPRSQLARARQSAAAGAPRGPHSRRRPPQFRARAGEDVGEPVSREAAAPAARFFSSGASRTTSSSWG